MDATTVLSLREFNSLIAGVLDIPQLKDVWVTAETVDVSRRNHCYMDLVEKDDFGRTVARVRAAIWANTLLRLDTKFYQATGQRFDSGMKVMVRVSASYHPQYGLSLVITDINPEFTLGDRIRRRNESIRRLTLEGIIDMNRELPIPEVIQRVAVISSETAAGYGDFMHQLHSNQAGIRFLTRCFPSPMQGDTAPQGIISALELIAAQEQMWDAVVIIRGGGATDDLSCFEDYDLAANIAQFPLPVIIGIGHERDITLLDYVAAMRVKTPTAAAEWIIQRAENVLFTINDLGNDILTAVKNAVSRAESLLDRCSAELPLAARASVMKAERRLETVAASLPERGKASIGAASAKLDSAADILRLAARNLIATREADLQSLKKLIDAYSPKSVLKRGYSFTTSDAGLVTSARQLAPGDVITTHLASGKIKSIVK